MSKKIEKVNFYLVLKKVLNDNYDDNFSFHIKKTDLFSEQAGNRYCYYLENNNNEKLFKSTSEEKANYQNKKHDPTKYFNLKRRDELDKILSPYVYKYQVLEIFPLIIETYLEEYGTDDKVNCLNNNDMEIISKLVQRYNERQAEAKIRTLSELK